jgi:hypothetical protein
MNRGIRPVKSLSIKGLYPYALAEGEGVGTAYEYYVKRLVLNRWLNGRKRSIKRVVVAGMPEKYGSSLDFWLLAEQLGASLTIFEDRKDAIDKAMQAREEACRAGLLSNWQPEYKLIASMDQIGGEYDLGLASEVLQRLEPTQQQDYVRRLGTACTAFVLFAPNGDNMAHTTHSGLSGITLSGMDALLAEAAGISASGYIDMPPFPPGITRSDEQRTQASSGVAEAVAMRGLGVYARLERLFPMRIRRSQSHIVYGIAHRQG